MTWRSRQASTYITQIRADLSVDGPVEWDATIDGAWSLALGVLAARVDERMAAALAQVSVDTADAVGLADFGRRLQRERRGAEPTRLALEITGTGVLLPSDVLDGFGGRWRIVEVYPPTTGGAQPAPLPLSGQVPLVTGTVVVVDAESGRRETVPLGGSTAIDFVPAKTGIGVALPPTVADAGDVAGVLYTGADAESVPAYRGRLLETPVRRSGSLLGLRAALLDLPGVEAIGLQTDGPAIARVRVVGQLAAGDLLRVAQTLYDSAPAFTVFIGAETYSVQGVDGQAASVQLSLGGSQAVEVAISVRSDLATQDAIDLAEAAILQVFGRLGEGDTLRWLQCIAALSSPSIVGASVTLDGGIADITPSNAANVLVPDFVSITAAPP